MKLYRNILIVIILFAVLGGAMYFVTHYLPTNQTENIPSSEPENDSDMISVYQAEASDVAKIHIKNAYGEYTLSREGEKWVFNNDPAIKITQAAADALAFSCTSVSVKQIVAETNENAQDFGFLNPTGFAELTFKDGTTKKITIGNPTLDNQNYYISLSGDSKIYLKNAYGTTSIIPESRTLRDLKIINLSTDDFSIFQSFSMSVQGKTPVKLKAFNLGTEEAPKKQWKMTNPTYAEVNGQVFANEVLDKLSTLTAVSVVEDHAKSFSKYGLDQPYATFSVETIDESYNIKIGDETESYRYLQAGSSNTVYVVTKSALTFLDVAYVDLMSNLIHVEYITDIDRVEIISRNKTYEMKIEGDTGKESYAINGKKMEKSAFSKAYQAVIGISLDRLDFTTLKESSPDVVIRYHKKDKSVVTVEFLSVNEREYRVIVDGLGNSITNKKNVNNVLNMIEDQIK